jgi:glycosyltransferase involved in cell wall biosynthesis
MQILKDLSIVVPAKDESKNLEFILPTLKKYSNDIIVVDGHSNDDTQNVCKKNNVSFVLDNKLGKGDAQRIGVDLAKNNIIIFFDSDGSHDYDDINILFDKIQLNEADLVICSRKKGGSYDLTSNISFIGFVRSTGCDFLTLIFNKVFKKNFSDILYSLKAIKKNKFLEIKTTENGFGIEIDILIKSIKKKLTIVEIPSREKSRVHGNSKLNTIVGIYFIFQILKSAIF